MDPKSYLNLLRQWIMYVYKNRKKPQLKNERKEMMQANMRKGFEDLGCNLCADKAMVEDQGIDTLDDLCSLKDGAL